MIFPSYQHPLDDLQEKKETEESEDEKKETSNVLFAALSVLSNVEELGQCGPLSHLEMDPQERTQSLLKKSTRALHAQESSAQKKITIIQERLVNSSPPSFSQFLQSMKKEDAFPGQYLIDPNIKQMEHVQSVELAKNLIIRDLYGTPLLNGSTIVYPQSFNGGEKRGLLSINSSSSKETDSFVLLMEAVRVINIPIQLVCDLVVHTLDAAYAVATLENFDTRSRPIESAMEKIGAWLQRHEPECLENLAHDLAIKHDVPYERVQQFYGDLLSIALIAAPLAVKGVRKGARKTLQTVPGSAAIVLDEAIQQRAWQEVLKGTSLDLPPPQMKPKLIFGEVFEHWKRDLQTIDPRYQSFIVEGYVKLLETPSEKILFMFVNNIQSKGLQGGSSFFSILEDFKRVGHKISDRVIVQAWFYQNPKYHYFGGDLQQVLEKRLGLKKIPPLELGELECMCEEFYEFSKQPS